MTETQHTSNKIANGMLAEFEGEIKTTRRFLERLPDDKLNWRPHEKSMTAGQLAYHIASLLKGVLSMGLQDESSVPNLDDRFEPGSTEEIIKELESSSKFVTEKLPTISDERMHAIIKIKSGEHVVMEVPRVGFLRMVLFNHWYHHRGQFGVYLRLIGVPVPSSYGPSADEAPSR